MFIYSSYFEYFSFSPKLVRASTPNQHHCCGENHCENKKKKRKKNVYNCMNNNLSSIKKNSEIHRPLVISGGLIHAILFRRICYHRYQQRG
jgi:hypothetical protein